MEFDFNQMNRTLKKFWCEQDSKQPSRDSRLSPQPGLQPRIDGKCGGTGLIRAKIKFCKAEIQLIDNYQDE